MEVLKLIAESNPSAQLLDGFDEAFVGIGRSGLSDPVAIYDRDMIASVLVRGGMTRPEAEQYIEQNIEACHVGEGTPIIARLVVRTDGEPGSALSTSL